MKKSYNIEKDNFESISENIKIGYAVGINKKGSVYSCKIARRYLKHGSILELGPAEGIMTEILYPLFPVNYTVVDGSSIFIDNLKKRFPDIIAVESLFENFSLELLPSCHVHIKKSKFDNIIMGHVLEHVEDPVMILKLCKEWLNDDGIIYASVPNKNSIHRQIGVCMGLLDTVDTLHDGDIMIGHRRVFGMDSFLNIFEQAGYKIKEKGGYWIKPLSNDQIESQWNESMIDAFMALGEKYPNIAANIYAVANK